MENKVKELKQVLGDEWQVKEGEASLLVETVKKGVVHCVDGRLMKGRNRRCHKANRGPKIQGGALGIAYLVAKSKGSKVVDEVVFREACQLIVDSGFVPGVHDMSGEHVHCGHCKLAMKGYFADLDLQIKPQRMVEVVKEFGGREILLEGGHEERVVRLNYREGTTLEPKGDAFGLDVWYVEKLDLSVEALLDNAIKTVAGLNGPRVIEIIE